MNKDFEQQVIIVTGASQGIGASIANFLAEKGAHVICLDRDPQGLAELKHSNIKTIPIDLSERLKTNDLINEIAKKYGRIDGLVTAAGGVCGQVGGPLESVLPEQWETIFDANLRSTLWCAQAIAPIMKNQGRGAIVTISSGAGLRPSLTGIQAYTSAKHALLGLTKQLALELGPAGIWVNSVAPGFVLSNPSTQKQWDVLSKEAQDTMINNINMRRLGKPQDLASVVAFLLSEQASWISGQILSVDGGHH